MGKYIYGRIFLGPLDMYLGVAQLDQTCFPFSGFSAASILISTVAVLIHPSSSELEFKFFLPDEDPQVWHYCLRVVSSEVLKSFHQIFLRYAGYLALLWDGPQTIPQSWFSWIICYTRKRQRGEVSSTLFITLRKINLTEGMCVCEPWVQSKDTILPGIQWKPESDSSLSSLASVFNLALPVLLSKIYPVQYLPFVYSPVIVQFWFMSTATSAQDNSFEIQTLRSLSGKACPVIPRSLGFPYTFSSHFHHTLLDLIFSICHPSGLCTLCGLGTGLSSFPFKKYV